MKQKRLWAGLLGVLLLLSGCAEARVRDVWAEKPRLYVALGDSICRGYRLTDPHTESYPALLARTWGCELRNYGVDGLTGEGLLRFLREGKAEGLREADIVTVSIGANDVLSAAFPALRGLFSVLGEGTPVEQVTAEIERGIEAFREELLAVLQEIRSRAPQAVVLVQTVYNPYAAFGWVRMSVGGTERSLAAFTDACVQRLNAILCEQAEAHGCIVCDVYGVFREATSADGERVVNASPLGLLFDPHPTRYGHTLIARAYEQALANA